MSNHKPYTHVRLIQDDDGNIKQRFEVRVSIFIESDGNAGRRAISGLPTKEKALEIAQQIARSERIRTGAPKWTP